MTAQAGFVPNGRDVAALARGEPLPLPGGDGGG
jgi:hypothetical protein